MNAKIVLLPGDGIGPEVVEEARLVLDAVAALFGHKFEYSTHLLGGCAIDATGTAMPDATLAACKSSAAVLLGAVGGPKWDDPQSPVRPEQGLLAIRKGLGLYANLRPVRAIPSLARLSPLKPERVAGVDFIVIRELTGGLYFGQPKGRTQTPEGERAVDTLIYTESEIRRIVRLAFELARGRRRLVTSIDKANVLESSRLWRKVAIEIGKEYPDVKLEHQLVDSAAMRLITHAANFDVIVTENMFGDILTDEAAVLGRFARAAAERFAGRGEARPVRADPRLRAGYCRQGHCQSRQAPFSPPPCCCVIRSAWKRKRRRSRRPLARRSMRASSPPISARRSRSVPRKWAQRSVND